MMFGLGKKKVKLQASFSGEVVAITAVPDQVFSSKMLGDGFAVIPGDDVDAVDVLSPCSGTIVTVFKTLHAFTLVSDEGLEVLVHVGLDTVELKGEPFEALCVEGDHVDSGQPVIRMNVAAVRQAQRNPITIIVCAKKKQVESVSLTSSGATAVLK